MTTSLKLCGVFFAVGCAIALCGAESRAFAQERIRTEDAKDGATVKGVLAAVDVEKNSITLTFTSFDRKKAESTESKKTYAIAKDAKIQQDGADAKLADLQKGFTTVIKLDGTSVASISVEGGTTQGEFRSVNTERNTITIIAGRNMTRQVVHLLKDPKVFGADGKPIRLQDLKPGTKLNITRSVEDGNTAIRLQVAAEKEKKER